MDENSSFITSTDVGPIKSNAFGEKYFYNLNRHSFEKISSHAQFNAKYGEQLFKPNSLNFIIGTDSGLLPLYLQQTGLPNGARYIFIEPTAVLEQLTNHRLLEQSDPAIACVSFDHWQESARQFKLQDYMYINAVQFFNAFCAEDDYCNLYAEISWHINEELYQAHFNACMAIGNETFITMQFANLADNLRPANLLNNAFQGKTVVLLAGGPSLDEALPWVQKNRRQLVVFAVSRISRQLKAIDLEPDFVFSVDPTELSFDISKEMLTFSNRPVFIYAYHSIPSLVSQWQGAGLYLGKRVPWKSTLNIDNNGEGAGPTVSNTALTIALRFGFKRIILAGVDLCFTREGYTHASGSDEHLAGPRFSLTSLQVKTNGGFMAPTSFDFAAAINFLAVQAQAITAAGCQMINFSANAAQVDNISYIPLKDIELDDKPLDVADIVTGHIGNTSHRLDNAPAIISELKRARFQINAILRLSEKALTINEGMYNAQGIIENYQEKLQLDKIERKLNREHRQYSRVVKRFGLRRFLKIVKPFTDEDWSAKEAKEMGNTYYQAYRDGSKAIIKIINDAIARTVARQEENKDQPDFDLLVKQWQKDRSYARAGLWRQNHPDAIIPVPAQTAFDALDKQFTAILADKNTGHMARAKSRTRFPLVRKRASLLFKHKKIPELNDLLTSLQKHQQQAEAMPYINLINGYLAELLNDVEAALDAYHHIIVCKDSPLLEEALLRVAVISIGSNNIDNTNAYLALQCLSQLNPSYLPHYAEIVRLRGDIAGAIDAYNHYICQFPEDTLVQIKLATLYMEIKVYNAAELAVEMVLAKKPDAKAALDLKKQLAYLKTLAPPPI